MSNQPLQAEHELVRALLVVITGLANSGVHISERRWGTVKNAFQWWIDTTGARYVIRKVDNFGVEDRTHIVYDRLLEETIHTGTEVECTDYAESRNRVA